MKNIQKKSQKVRTTLAITKEAQDTIYDFGYASARTQGEFISDLIISHHAARQLERGRRKLTTTEIAGELAKLADLLDDVSSVDRAVVAAKLIRLAAGLLSE